VTFAICNGAEQGAEFDEIVSEAEFVPEMGLEAVKTAAEKKNSLGLNIHTGGRVYAHKSVKKEGYTTKQAWTGKKGHYYLGPSRRRIGAGFGRRRRTITIVKKGKKSRGVHRLLTAGKKGKRVTHLTPKNVPKAAPKKISQHTKNKLGKIEIKKILKIKPGKSRRKSAKKAPAKKKHSRKKHTKKKATCKDKRKGHYTRWKYKYKTYSSRCAWYKQTKKCHYSWTRRHCSKTCRNRGNDSRWGKNKFRTVLRKKMTFASRCAYTLYNRLRFQGQNKKHACTKNRWIARSCQFTCTGKGFDKLGQTRNCPTLKPLKKSSGKCPKANAKGKQEVSGNCLKRGLKVGSLCDGDGECGTNPGRRDINNCWWISGHRGKYRRGSQGADMYEVTALPSGKPKKPKPYTVWVSVVESKTRMTWCKYYKSRKMCRTRKMWMSRQCANTCNMCGKAVCSNQYPSRPFHRNKYYRKKFSSRCAYYKARADWYKGYCKQRKRQHKRYRCGSYYNHKKRFCMKTFTGKGRDTLRNNKTRRQWTFTPSFYHQYSSRCAYYKHFGYCSNHSRSWAVRKCSKTCTGKGKDFYTTKWKGWHAKIVSRKTYKGGRCEWYKSRGYCKRSRSWMNRSCAKECGFCKSKSQPKGKIHHSTKSEAHPKYSKARKAALRAKAKKQAEKAAKKHKYAEAKAKYRAREARKRALEKKAKASKKEKADKKARAAEKSAKRAEKRMKKAKEQHAKRKAEKAKKVEIKVKKENERRKKAERAAEKLAKKRAAQHRKRQENKAKRAAEHAHKNTVVLRQRCRTDTYWDGCTAHPISWYPRCTSGGSRTGAWSYCGSIFTGKAQCRKRTCWNARWYKYKHRWALWESSSWGESVAWNDDSLMQRDREADRLVDEVRDEAERMKDASMDQQDPMEEDLDEDRDNEDDDEEDRRQDRDDEDFRGDEDLSTTSSEVGRCVKIKKVTKSKAKKVKKSKAKHCGCTGKDHSIDMATFYALEAVADDELTQQMNDESSTKATKCRQWTSGGTLQWCYIPLGCPAKGSHVGRVAAAFYKGKVRKYCTRH